MSGTTASSSDAPRREPDASLDWMRQVQTQQRENESSNGVLRNIYKRAKQAGENVDVMRRVVRKLRSHSPEEIIEDLQAEIYYLNLRKVGITSQSLFTDLDLYVTENGSIAEAMFAAQERGYSAGRLGTKIDECPYQPGTEMHVAWVDHWKKGQAAIARELGPDAKQADASRARPRRARQQALPGTDQPSEDNADLGNEPKRAKATRKAAPKKKAGRKNGGARAASRRRAGALRPNDKAEDGSILH